MVSCSFIKQYSQIIVCAICFFLSATCTAKTLNLTLSDERVDATPYLTLLEDPTGLLDFQAIQTSKIQSQFSPISGSIGKGYSNSAFWVKLDLSYNSHTPSITDPSSNNALRRQTAASLIPDNLWFVDVGYPSLDDIRFYFTDKDNGTTEVQLGDYLKFDDRAIPIPHWVIPISLQNNQVHTVYLRVKTVSSVRIPLVIRSATNTMFFHRNFQMGYGLYFGIIASFFLYNFFMFLFFRDRSYLYYVCYVASFAMAVASVIGFGYTYLWPEKPWITDIAIVQSIALFCIFSLLFSQSFLHTKRHSPNTHKVLSALIILGMFIFILGLLVPYQVGVKCVAFMSVTSSIAILWSGFLSLFTGVKVAKYFVLAWTTVLIGSGLFALMSNGLVPANFFTHYAVQFGSALEVILLSFALADRMHRLQQEKKHLEQEAKDALQKANQELCIALEDIKKSNRLKDDFLATISHELRTPMNGIEGALDLAQSEKSPEKSIEMLRIAALSASKMTSLVDTILEYSEIQANKTRIQLESCDVQQFITRLVQPTHQSCREKGIAFSYSIDERIAEKLDIDERALGIMLRQLLDNAVKFTQRGTIQLHAEIHTTTPDVSNALTVTITDTGIGIPADAIDEIFTPFHQLDRSFSRGYGGLGIGLTICKTLADKIGGTLEIARDQQQGSTFILSIPYHPTTVSNQPIIKKHKKKPSTPPGPLSPETTILIVEDNPVNQQILVGILRKLGYDYQVANHGQEALTVIQEHTVNLVLMDCQMPVMDGFEATQAIRKSNNNVPIIAVTANAMSEDRTKCLKAGMNDYVKKPINRKIIQAKINQWL
ncbi:hypothetical protein A9Q99_06620 [Gammaproteobacteria bacterium 45_16_T64]|nr:hypothetical protein A9Q99_06620 [Gammaproteobacteria bacterium 45_16_T64]